MKRIKMQKGITLIALIITIIILLILAVVTIGSIKNSNIITYAQNAATDYNTKKDDEEDIINEYELLIKSNVLEENKSNDTIIETIVSENTTINGEMYSYKNPVIPAGFMAVNVTTKDHESYWDAEEGPEIYKGLVISDGNSEFVWIPVQNIDEFVKKYDDTNYQGVLYNFYGTTATKRSNNNTTSYREPANLNSVYDTKSQMSIWSQKLYQESFNKMVESVSKYGGFYVGRYETSLNGSTAQSKAGETPMKNKSWYEMYENSLLYSKNNTNLGVTSEMIWGCQWDAMLKFILKGKDAEHVTSKEKYVGHTTTDFETKPYKTGGTNYSEVYTGKVGYSDIASNIYDLEGNVAERTQEAYDVHIRVSRGGHCYYNGSVSPSVRDDTLTPTNTSNYRGSRLALYVDV